MKNPLELYRLLDKSNCRACLLPSCMAFAVAVIQGQKSIEECPHASDRAIEAVRGKVVVRKSIAEEQQERLHALKQAIAAVDFASVAERLGGRTVPEGLAIPCLGKEFVVNATGELRSECHSNLWVQVPLLNYIINGQGRHPTGRLVAFAQLPKGGDWSRFFAHRCETGLQQLANAHPDLFFELLDLFGSRPLPGTGADRSLRLHPLPRLPLVVNYWAPEPGLGAKLNLLFDETAADNLGVDAIYLLCQGMVEMFRALIVKHSRDGKLF